MHACSEYCSETETGYVNFELLSEASLHVTVSVQWNRQYAILNNNQLKLIIFHFSALQNSTLPEEPKEDSNKYRFLQIKHHTRRKTNSEESPKLSRNSTFSEPES
jgi:hypothetical protein